MALMDENGMYGSIGELAVAQQLVWQRCAVNSITQMDYGTDLTVQLPVMPCTPEARPDKNGRPMLHNEVWPLSTHHVHVQVKSARRPHSEHPTSSVSKDLVQSWLPTGRNIPPTFLILIDVSGPVHSGEKMDDAPRFLFTPGDFIDQVTTSKGASIPFTGSEATRIRPDDDLLRRIHAWTEHSHIVGALLDEGVQLPPRARRDPDEAWRFASLLVRSWLYEYTTPSGELSASQGDEVKSKLLRTMSLLGYAESAGDAYSFETRADEEMMEIMSDTFSSHEWPDAPFDLRLLSRRNDEDSVWADVEGFAHMWGEPVRALGQS